MGVFIMMNFWSLYEYLIHRQAFSFSVNDNIGPTPSSPVPPPLFRKLGEMFGTSSYHLTNCEKILGFNIGHAHMTCCPKPYIDTCKATLADQS